MPANDKVANSFLSNEGAPTGEVAPLSSRDQMSYMADIIEELHQMARRARLQTLAGLLDLAHSEARLQITRSNADLDRLA